MSIKEGVAKADVATLPERGYPVRSKRRRVQSESGCLGLMHAIAPLIIYCSIFPVGLLRLLWLWG